MNDAKSAIVLFSGGQDSTTCLAWALDRFEKVETISFDYRQRHLIELESRLIIREKIIKEFPIWRDRLGKDHLVDLGALKNITDSYLTKGVEISFDENGIPNTFVPGRNIIFMVFAAIVAHKIGVRNIVGGMCETDFSGYPDCRDDTIKALQVALNLGMDRRFVLHTPLMWIDKAATWDLAEQLGGGPLVDLIINDSHTCYRGERGRRWDWGYGCGECPACQLRARGYTDYRAHHDASQSG